jgi:hypothetical protein
VKNRLRPFVGDKTFKRINGKRSTPQNIVLTIKKAHAIMALIGAGRNDNIL